MTVDEDALLAEQVAYYRARAPEYDRVYAERADLRSLLTVVEGLPIAGDVLEPACGTGRWTGALAARARSVTAVDASPEAAREEVAAEVRRLDDGSRYRIVKVFHEPERLTGELAALGWSADIRQQGEFIIGTATASAPRPPS
ncbi:hypothetical protein [Streptomyces sp. NPDC058457]|uniref:hypothetical protein n=1 Tax=Streptomyces sp. NPDC058457 TaxID=3346507 RepID=UPI00365BC9C6